VKTEVKTPCLPTVNQKLGIVQPGTTDIGLSNPQLPRASLPRQGCRLPLRSDMSSPSLES